MITGPERERQVSERDSLQGVRLERERQVRERDILDSERQIRERDMLEGERLVWETGEQARQLTVRQVRERETG